MGIYPWNKFLYFHMWKYQFFPAEPLLHNYKCGGYVPCCVTVNTHTIVNWKNSATEYALAIKLVGGTISPTRLILMRTLVTRGLILIFKIYD